MDKFKQKLQMQLTEAIELITQLVVEAIKEEKSANLRDNVVRPDEKILTFNEVCNHFNLSPTTLERRIRAGLKYSQAVKKGNRLFKLSDCEHFFNLNKNSYESKN